MKNKKRMILMLFMALLIMAMPVSAQASFKVTAKTGVSVPTTMKKGAFFNVKGTIKTNEAIAKISCTIYNSTGKKCLQRYDARPYAKKFNLKAADPYLEFNKLAAGKYYYRICVYNSNGTKRRVVNKKFTVTATTTTKGSIKISNAVPSQNVILNNGTAYSIGGTITSTYNLKSVTARILNNSNEVQYKKTVSTSKKTYKVNNSTLDSAMAFDKLADGTYTFYLNAVDVKKNNVTLVKKTITVKTDSTNTNTNVNPGSTGSNTNSGSSTYLDYNGIVTQPSGFRARTGRPSASNKYFYSGSYNIYYKYNGLAPTGKVYYANQYVLGNCTWYACGRAMEIVANAGGNVANVKAIFGGDPVGIYNTNASLIAKGKGGFSYGTTPKIGALAIFNYGSSGDAHIAVVENIVNGVPYVSESGYTVGATMPKSDKSNIVFRYQSIYNWAGGRQILGYIYLV